MRAALQASVEPGSVVFTDDHFAYRDIERLPSLHESVKHSEKAFVRKGVHTNGIESVWALLKRSFKGIDHHWSVKHCRRCIDELTFRLNEGSGSVGTLEFLGALCKGAVGKRLTYASLTRGPAMSRLWDFEERHLRCDRSGRKRLGIVSRSPAAIAAGVENPEKGCGMMPFPVIGTFPCKSLI